MTSKELFDSILEQTLSHGGSMQLNLADPMHYEFFLSRYGGAERIRQDAPDFYCAIEQARAEENANLGLATNEYGLESVGSIENYSQQITTNAEGENGMRVWTLTAHPTASFSQNPPYVLGEYRFYDSDLGAEIGGDSGIEPSFSPQENSYTITAKSGGFNGEDNLRGRHLNVMAIFTGIKPCADNSGKLTVSPLVCAADFFVRSTADDVDKVELQHPIAHYKHDDPRYADCVCIAYNREWHMENPDYIFDEYLSHGITDMPVHMPIVFTVQLKNDATFVPVNGSYLSEDEDPTVTLSCFTDESGVVIPGRAVLRLDWEEASKNYITVDTAKNNVLTLKLNTATADKPDFKWRSLLHSDPVMDSFTHSVLQAKFVFNTKNRISPTQFALMGTSVYLKYDAATNPNEVHVDKICYEWGCVAADTEIALEHGTKRACEVAIGESILCRNGKTLVVRDIAKGKENQILHISAGERNVSVTRDHTLSTQNGPCAAADIRAGDLIELWDFEKERTYFAPVTEIETAAYEGLVYNFQMEESEFLIGNGVLVGDIPMQQSVRPRASHVRREQHPFDPAALNRITAQMRALSREKPYADFVPSDKPECLQLHYFTVKLFAKMCDLSDDQAQVIGEICQLIGDNATTGGLRLRGHIPPWVADEGWFRPDPTDPMVYNVLIAPTAMENWYSGAELNASKQWFPDEPASDPQTRFHNIQTEILKPFHFFPGGDENAPERTVYHSEPLRQKLKEVEDKFIPYREDPSTTPKALLIEAGVMLHVLIDTMLHEHLCASRDKLNLAVLMSAEDAEGNRITGNYPPDTQFKDYNKSAYTEQMICPAGLQRVSRVLNETFAEISYNYPKPGMDDETYYQCEPNAWNAFAKPLSDFYSRRSLAALNFLQRCLGIPELTAELWTGNDKRMTLNKLFQNTATTFPALSEIWQSAFPDIPFSYSAESVYERLMEGDEKESDPDKRYADFYAYSETIMKLRNYFK